jgi:hypothetical protein
MRKAHSLLLSLVFWTLPQQAVSWNPTTWFQDAPKKHEYSLTSLFNTASRFCQTHAQPYMHYARHHQQQLAVGAGLLAVSVCMRSFTKLQAALQKPDAWAHWKHTVPLARHMMNEQLSYELLHEIQVRYMKLHAVADFMGPVRTFMQDVRDEIGFLRRYRRQARLLQNCGLYVMVDSELVLQIDERIERLEALRLICLHWLAKTKLDPVLT